MIPSAQVGPLSLTPALVLAPMSGVTCSPFRRLIRELNPGSVGLVVSEFVSVEGLTRDSKRSFEMLRFQESERPVGLQIFGYDIDRMGRAAKMVEEMGADVLDVNCGCPAPKVVKRGGGCELMRQPLHLAAMLRAVRQAVSIPLTVKMRSGWDDASLNVSEVAHIAEEEGAQAIAVHGRSRVQLYRGTANWDIVEQVAAERSIPVFGSGDVVDAASAAERLRPGVAGLYIGRAAIENPWVFGEIVSGREGGARRDPALQLKALRRYAELLAEDFEPKYCVGRLKQLASQMVRGNGWARSLCRVNSFAEQLDLLAQRESAVQEEGKSEWFSCEMSRKTSTPMPSSVA